ncbi:MAG: hypothetical protein ABJE95_09550 [Byssovorax sp.]
MKSRHPLLAALGVLLLGSAATMACTSPDRPYGPDGKSGSSGTAGTGGTGSSATSTGATGSASTGATMGSTGSGTTTTIPCLAASECPGKETECQTRTCDKGFCGIGFSPLGKKIATQSAGDCRKTVCNGQGLLTQQVDDADLPEDSNPCTVDICNAGLPDHHPVASGASCGGVLSCDGLGNCTGCTTPSECPGADTDCQTRSCKAKVCGFDYQPADTAAKVQVDHDCKQNVCNGAGLVSAAFDNADTLDDGNPCTQDGCLNGSDTHVNLAANAPCPDGSKPFCNGSGACVECVTASTCPGQGDECKTPTCVGGSCGFTFKPMGTALVFQIDGDCHLGVCDGNGGQTQTAVDNDPQSDSNPCTTDTCAKGTTLHTPVATGTACGGAKTCNAGGVCSGCLAAADCAGASNECQATTCVGGNCGVSFTPSGTPISMQIGGDCKTSVCDGSGNVVVAVDDSDVGVDGDQCTSDLCSNGTPGHPQAPSGTLCSMAGGQYCNDFGMCNECNPGSVDNFSCGCDSGPACCGVAPFAVVVISDLAKNTTEPSDDPVATADMLPCCCPSFRYCDGTGTWGPCQ